MSTLFPFMESNNTKGDRFGQVITKISQLQSDLDNIKVDIAWIVEEKTKVQLESEKLKIEKEKFEKERLLDSKSYPPKEADPETHNHPSGLSHAATADDFSLPNDDPEALRRKLSHLRGHKWSLPELQTNESLRRTILEDVVEVPPPSITRGTSPRSLLSYTHFPCIATVSPALRGFGKLKIADHHLLAWGVPCTPTDYGLILIDAESKHVVSTFAKGSKIYSADKSGDTLTAGGEEGLLVVDTASGREYSIPEVPGPVLFVKTAGGAIFSCAKGSEVVQVWDTVTLKLQQEIPGNISCGDISENLMVSGSEKSVQIWDLRSGKKISVFSGHSGPVRCVQFHYDLIVSGGEDGLVKIWDMASRRNTRTLSLDGEVTSLRVLRDGVLVTGEANGKMKIWSSSGQCCYKMRYHDNVASVDVQENHSIFSMGIENEDDVNVMIRIWKGINLKF